MQTNKHTQWGSIPVTTDGLDLRDRLFVLASLIGVLLWSFPHPSLAQTIAEQPMVFEVNANLPLLPTREDYLARALAADYIPEPPDPRVAILREYLVEKNSPLADNAEVLLQQYHYRLIIGISFAESNFCKVQIRPNNCWGIGGGYPESYDTLADGVVRANSLIQRYHNNGMTSPRLMRNTWVGWPNQNWVTAVEQVTETLESRGL
ncbi:MAG: hypothetical protein A3E92_03130 [Candidatus Taylorbacteria bacterium RIFCSPHIGHO2_12_FULL_42_34]|nr:MAG: hypothetical protein A3E92_03130 [Candidatus Taylorbacteria bacterium RIFCSPHIGHO2_12_FULL_42_34]